MSFDPATTPDRGLYLEINTPDVRLGRAIQRVSRPADRIKPVDRPGFPKSSHVRRFTGLAWGMTPLLTDFTNGIVQGLSPSGFALNGLLMRLTGFNVPFGDNTVVEHYAWKNPNDLPGVTTPGTLPSFGMPVWRRTVPAGQSWAAGIDADAYPKPTLPSQHVTMDRLMIGRQTYGPNQGFVLGFYAPPLFGSVEDSFLTFYFGGPTDVTPGPSADEGCWALTMRGSGDAILFEKFDTGWAERDTFKWTNEPRPRGGLVTIEIIPYSSDKIVFRSSAIATDNTEGGHFFAAGTFRRSKTDFLAYLFQHSATKSGHTHTKSVSGAGNLRLDFRRDWRFEAMLGMQAYPDTSELYDEPFQIPTVPAGVPMRITAKRELPPDTSIDIRLYDATTHAELTFDPVGDEAGPFYVSNAGQRFYYARITFTSAGKVRAPLLYDYTVTVDGFLSFTTPESVSARVLDASLTGIDYNSPDHEMGTLEVMDYTNALAILKDRARVRSRVCTDCTWPDEDTGEPIETFSVLLDGEVAHSPASPIVHPKDHVWPVAGASHYGMTVVGMWARIWDATLPALESLVDPTTGEMYTVSQLITGLFHRAGFTANYTDIPETNYRLQPSTDKDKNVIPNGARVGEQIIQYAGDYTDLLIFWDANAKKVPDETMDGIWRGVFFPEPPFNFVWNFTRFPPSSGLSHLSQSYPTDTHFIEHYHEWTQPPELNRLIFLGGSDGTEEGYQFKAEYRNKRSYRPSADDPEPDTHHPDYIGYEILKTLRRTACTTKEATNYVGRRVFKDTAFGYPRFDFDAPLVLIWDLNDPYQIRPRPLRLGDMVQIDGRPFMITCCNPRARRGPGDRYQQAYYEGFYRDSFVGPQQVWEEPD